MLPLTMRDVSRAFLDLVCGPHRLKYPNAVQVGEAWTDGVGAWTVTSFRRTGKGNPRGADGRRVVQGVPVKIRWPGSEMLALDTTTVHDDWGWHNVLLGSAPFADEEDSRLLGGRLLGVYRCPHKFGGDDRKHWVGFNDTDELIKWLENALDEGARELPLPLLEPVVPAHSEILMNRIPPRLPVSAMKTYRVSAPLATHWRKVTCTEYECAAHTDGWVTVCDENTDLGVAQAAYIRHRSGRSFTETRTGSGLVTFTFGPDQEPFPGRTHEHRIKMGRPELFEVIGGDWRGNPRREKITHNTPDNWVEDFAEHQDRLATRQNRG